MLESRIQQLSLLVPVVPVGRHQAIAKQGQYSAQICWLDEVVIVCDVHSPQESRICEDDSGKGPQAEVADRTELLVEGICICCRCR